MSAFDREHTSSSTVAYSLGLAGPDRDDVQRPSLALWMFCNVLYFH